MANLVIGVASWAGEIASYAIWGRLLAIWVREKQLSYLAKNVAACTAAAAMFFGASLISSQPASAQFKQQGSKLVGSGADGPAQQGSSLALSRDGNTALIGAPFDHWGGAAKSSGAAWIFTRSNGAWAQQGSKLVGVGMANSGAFQGSGVALSANGDTAIVGAPADGHGSARVFIRSNGVWKQQGGKLVGTGAAAGGANQGSSVALSADGNTALIGGPEDNHSAGAVWVFTRSNGVWKQQGHKLVGTGAVRVTSQLGSHQGAAVALSADGNT
ncbi:MAG TPA: hypothetical protein VG986_19510, partial [Pseudolabrys sp.]|nr:hypothetical protein [Pseudolabrys sp.]